ncbi:Rieske (2Fe-2S) protein [Comamonas guangdongensis]|uniref:Rieske (2Fe-2S) protein n=1 Tax=Comamonas guangdongensis TaxID=510515 RepID=A0ABV4A0K7_9BURK
MLEQTLPARALIAAGPAEDLPPGSRKLVFVPGGETVLLLNVEGEFYALENSCPHAGASIASGPCQAHEIACPAHGLKFNIKSGQCTASPRLLIPLYEVLILEEQLWLRPPQRC